MPKDVPSSFIDRLAALDCNYLLSIKTLKMEKKLLKPNVQVGQTVLRRKSNGGEADTWVKCYVNDTYFDLINEFPEDYRQLDGSELGILVQNN